MEYKYKVDKFKDLKPVRVSQKLYEFDKFRFKLSVHGYRLLYALAQSLDYNQKDLFPEYGFDKAAIFKYLGLESTKRKYELLNDALRNIGDNWLCFKIRKNNGAIRWEGMAWITSYSFATDEKMLTIQINEKVKPFLINLKQYALIRPKDYLNLSTEYQNWFYPYLKNVTKLGKWRVAIEDLKQALFLEKTPTYDPKQNKNATEHFLKNVIGIQISQKAKLENQLATKNKRKPKLIDWDYTKDRKGNKTGTLYGITKGTDIHVTASVEKTGRSYSHIIFYISEKRSNKQAIIQGAENDMQKAQQKGKRNKGLQRIGDLFSDDNTPEIIPAAKVIYYTMEQIIAGSKELNLTQAVFIEKMRLKPVGDGKRYYKEY